MNTASFLLNRNCLKNGEKPFSQHRLPYCLIYFCKNILAGDMMKRSMGLWQLMGFAVISLGGTVLHFLYEWLGGTLWIAPLSGVNESTWEHMKLLFWPMLIFAIVQGFFFRDRKDFWCVKLRGILLGLILIPVLFYTYNGVVGKSPDWLNIAIFFISAAISYLYETRLFNLNKVRCNTPKLPLTILCSIALLFVIFTFATPEIGIFKDPLTGTYGTKRLR